MNWWWTLLAAMDEHQGQAAWAGAVGTVLAILASSVLAIAVPIWMKDRDERTAVRRALQFAEYAAGQLISGWESLREILDRKEFHRGSAETLRVSVRTAQRLLGEVPHPFMAPSGAAYLHRCALSAQSFDDALSALEAHPTPYLLGLAIPIDEIIKEIGVAESAFSRMKPVKRGGLWTASDLDLDPVE